MKRFFVVCAMLIAFVTAASADSLSQILFPMDFIDQGISDYVIVVFDTTTEDAEDARIIEIVAMKVSNDKMDGFPFYKYVNPETELPERVQQLYNMYGRFKTAEERLADAPPFRDIVDEFVEYCGDLPIVMYDAQSFALPVLLREADECGVAINNKVVDLLWMARIYFQGWRSYSLFDMSVNFDYSRMPYEEPSMDAAYFLHIVKQTRKADRLIKATVAQSIY